MFPIDIELINIKRKNEYLIKNGKINIQNNDFIYLEGKNHTGKTTLLNIINANEIESLKVEAKIFLNGTQLKESDVAGYKRKISLVEQKDVFFAKTPYEELAFEFEKYGNEINYSLIEELIEEFNISHLKDKKVKMEKLSGGEKRKLSIIKGLLKQNINILIIDEPFNNLDLDSVVKVINALYKIHKEKQIAIIVTSHFPLFIGPNKKWTIKDSLISECEIVSKMSKVSWIVDDKGLRLDEY